MHWNLMNHEELGSYNFLKLKYKMGDQINNCTGEYVSPKQLRPPYDEKFGSFKFLNLK